MVAAACTIVIGPLSAQTTPAAGIDPAIAKLLAGIRAADKGQLAVS